MEQEAFTRLNDGKQMGEKVSDRTDGRISRNSGQSWVVSTCRGMLNSSVLQADGVRRGSREQMVGYSEARLQSVVKRDSCCSEMCFGASERDPP